MTFDVNSLGTISRRLATAALTAQPRFERYASAVKGHEADGLSLVPEIPSPPGDAGRLLTVWVDEVCTPSIGFGPTHTHEAPDDDGIAAVVDRAKAVLADQVVIIRDVGGLYPGGVSFLDLRDGDALMEELTSPHSPGQALLISWSGQSDRAVSTESLPG